MKVMLNFKCSCGKVTEERIDNKTKSIVCECGEVATKMLSAPRSFGNTCGKSPSTRY